MVKIDVIILDIGELSRVKVELTRHNVNAFCFAIGKVCIGQPRLVRITDVALNAINASAIIVKGREDDRCAKLAFIDQIFRATMVSIYAEGKATPEFLLKADVEIILPLSKRRGAGEAVRRFRTEANILSDACGGDV